MTDLTSNPEVIGWLVESAGGRDFFWKEGTARCLAPKMGDEPYTITPLVRGDVETASQEAEVLAKADTRIVLNAEQQALVDRAELEHAVGSDDEVEIAHADDGCIGMLGDAENMFSRGDDGVWVRAWVWIRNPEPEDEEEGD
jgi:hypothetical protein